MEHIDALLWDVDGTLLDFAAAERAAIRSLFAEFGLGDCTDGMLARYAAINRSYWEKLERGEMSRPAILVGRFADFLRELEQDAGLAPALNEAYQRRLGETIVFRDDSKTLVASLRGRIPQYAVSNGTVVAQTGKLRRSGFDQLLDGVFLSEQLGAEKPAVAFFEPVLRAIGSPDRQRVLMVGDSLTSDILGGSRAGIRSCWYNPDGLPNATEARPDYEIRNLWEVTRLL